MKDPLDKNRATEQSSNFKHQQLNIRASIEPALDQQRQEPRYQILDLGDDEFVE